MKRIIWAIVILVVVGGIVALDYASPLWALRNIQAAARENDSDTLAGYVAFEALRADLKADLRARMDSEGGDNPLAQTLGDAFIDPLVEAVVTPRGIRAVFDARASGSGAGALGGAAGLAMPNLGEGDPVVSRTGLNTFTVAPPNGRGALVFTRAFPFSGWKLSGVDLPADQAPPATPQT